jgi:hypothetical protein
MNRFRNPPVALTAFALAVATLAIGAAPAAAQVVGDLNAFEFPDSVAKPKAPDALSDLPKPTQPAARLPNHTPEFANPRPASDPAPRTAADGKFTIRRMPGRAK